MGPLILIGSIIVGILAWNRIVSNYYTTHPETWKTCDCCGHSELTDNKRPWWVKMHEYVSHER